MCEVSLVVCAASSSFVHTESAEEGATMFCLGILSGAGKIR